MTKDGNNLGNNLSRDDIRNAINAKKKDIQSDNPQVEISRMNHEAVGKLADDHNDVFSQLTKDTLQDETFDYALAITFARNPLKSLEERLRSRGIKEMVTKKCDLGAIEEPQDVRIKVDLFEDFLKEFLVRRHCLNRNRVDEYIQALDKANGKDTILQDMNRNNNRGILSRLG